MVQQIACVRQLQIRVGPLHLISIRRRSEPQSNAVVTARERSNEGHYDRVCLCFKPVAVGRNVGAVTREKRCLLRRIARCRRELTTLHFLPPLQKTRVHLPHQRSKIIFHLEQLTIFKQVRNGLA